MEKERSNGFYPFLHSTSFKLFLCVLAFLFVVFDKAVLGTLVFVVITSLLLLLQGGGSLALLPFLLICGISMRCYDSFDTFITYWPVAVLPVVVLLLRLIWGIRELKKDNIEKTGKSFYPNLMVAIAVTLGGYGSISASDYFSPVALYYVIFLGFGMILFYLVARAGIFKSEKNLFNDFAKTMYLFGIFCAFCIFHIYIANIPLLMEKGFDLDFAKKFQWQNNVSTMLFFCLPFPFYFARKNALHFFWGFIMFVSLLLTTARSALLISPVLFIICAIYAVSYNKKNILTLVLSLGLSAACFFALKQIFVYIGAEAPLKALSPDTTKLKSFFSFVSGSEARNGLIVRSFEDFRSAPFFGKGLGYTGINDLYSPKKGAMHWYHMMIPQVIGSLGLFGIFAYTYQIIVRIGLVFKKKTPYNLCLGISYLGILLMSQVNPGEFCPLPYELLTVLIFIILEKSITVQEKE